MLTYKVPLRDIRFVLYELLGAGELAQLPGFAEASPELVDAVLGEAAKFCESVLLPLNQTGDREGCRFENGVVRTPAGFKEAYAAFARGGWTGLACDPAHGGQGLPEALNFVVVEMICATNVAFGTYPGLSRHAYQALAAHAPEAIKRQCLPRLASGEWSGTMCLTEPQCGTDLGLVRTKAVPAADGSYALSGTKIFISAGEHDLTGNILHLVLARLPNAPAGTSGISLFLVPKLLWHDTGSPGHRNGVRCAGIEHKMGLAGSATCALQFEDAVGYLVGEPNRGLHCMFTMMNAARLAVGLQGLGLAEIAYQNARTYARNRLAGRALGGARHPDRPADPIIVQPDVRRMLLTMRAGIEGARALAYWTAVNIDIAHRHPASETRQEADELVQLLTPVIKACLTDLGFEAANLGVQIYGGHGYIRDNGMEQLVRDSRIAQIYEGTNGIQALDLVGRKMSAHYGRLLRRLFHPLAQFLGDAGSDMRLQEFVEPLAKAFDRLQRATLKIAERGLRNPDEAGAAAYDYLRLMGLVTQSYMWARMARLAADALDRNPSETDFYRSKIATARFFAQRVLPQSSSLFAAIMAGGRTITEFDEQAL
jgi:alkylation response protein AidB-like acyl-CoA dehydrogenase